MPDGGVAAVPSVGGVVSPVDGTAGSPLAAGAMNWFGGAVVFSAGLPADLCQQPARANGSMMALRKTGIAGLFILALSAMC